MTTKRAFRAGSPSAAAYPTFEEFEGSRRGFLSRLGIAVGLGAVGSMIGCGRDRRIVVHSNSDGGLDQANPTHPIEPNVAGGAPQPYSPIDARPDNRPTQDLGREDLGPSEDVEWPMQGGERMPDAQVDPPSWPQGGAPAPDAGIDGDNKSPPALIDAGNND